MYYFGMVFKRDSLEVYAIIFSTPLVCYAYELPLAGALRSLIAPCYFHQHILVIKVSNCFNWEERSVDSWQKINTADSMALSNNFFLAEKAGTTDLQVHSLLSHKQQRQSGLCKRGQDSCCAMQQSVKGKGGISWPVYLALGLSAVSEAVGMDFDSASVSGLSKKYPPIDFLWSASKSHFITFSHKNLCNSGEPESPQRN